MYRSLKNVLLNSWKLIAATSVLLLASGLMTGCAGPQVAEQSAYEKIEYIVDVPSFSKDELYDGVLLWIADNFHSSRAVIDYSDKSQGVIIGNGVIPNITLKSGMVQMNLDAEFKMKIEIKEAKMRLTFSNFRITSRSNSLLWKEEADQIRGKLVSIGEKIASDLKEKRASKF